MAAGRAWEIFKRDKNNIQNAKESAKLSQVELDEELWDMWEDLEFSHRMHWE